MSVREHNNELQIPEEFLQTLETILKNVIKYQKVKRLPVEPYAIFCHGDFLRNNVAFKYLDEVCIYTQMGYMLYLYRFLAFSFR